MSESGRLAERPVVFCVGIVEGGSEDLFWGCYTNHLLILLWFNSIIVGQIAHLTKSNWLELLMFVLKQVLILL